MIFLVSWVVCWLFVIIFLAAQLYPFRPAACLLLFKSYLQQQEVQGCKLEIIVFWMVRLDRYEGHKTGHVFYWVPCVLWVKLAVRIAWLCGLPSSLVYCNLLHKSPLLGKHPPHFSKESSVFRYFLIKLKRQLIWRRKQRLNFSISHSENWKLPNKAQFRALRTQGTWIEVANFGCSN